MKSFYIILACLSLIVFAYNFYLLLSHDFTLQSFPINPLEGFADSGTGDQRYEEILNLLNQKAQAYKLVSEELNLWATWTNLSVTAITAFSTLVATVKAVKSSPTETRFVLTIAILGFLGTITGWGSSQFSDRKSKADQNLQKSRNEKFEFMAIYDKASNSNERDKIIRLYHEKATDL